VSIPVRARPLLQSLRRTAPSKCTLTCIVLALAAAATGSLFPARNEGAAASQQAQNGVAPIPAKPSPSVQSELVRLQREKGLSLLAVHNNRIFAVDFAERKMTGHAPFLTKGTATWGSISPDGTEVAFDYCPEPCEIEMTPGALAAPPSPHYLALAGADGTRLREYPHLAWPSGFCWSPDKSRLALQVENRHENAPTEGALQALDLNSGRLEVIADNEYSYVTAECWSPDGTQVVYTRNMLGLQVIRVYDLARRATREISTGPSNNEATWAPDGERLAFLTFDLTSPRGPSQTYYVVGAFGGVKRPIVHPRYAGGPLMWSPDSRYAAYVGCASAASSTSQLWVVRLVDGAQDWLATLTDTDPSWFQWVEAHDSLKR